LSKALTEAQPNTTEMHHRAPQLQEQTNEQKGAYKKENRVIRINPIQN